MVYLGSLWAKDGGSAFSRGRGTKADKLYGTDGPVCFDPRSHSGGTP